MSKAENDNIPVIPIDKEVARLCLQDARNLVADGHSPEEAATLACHGAWLEWRPWVLAILEGRRSVIRDLITTPEEAAAVTRRTYGDRAQGEALRRAEESEAPADAEFWREVADLL